MNAKKLIALVGAFGIMAGTAFAQQNGPGPGGNSGTPNPVTPPRYNRPATPAEVQARLQQFKQDCEALLTQQRLMEQQSKDVSIQERDRIRDQLCDQMEQFNQVMDVTATYGTAVRQQLRVHGISAKQGVRWDQGAWFAEAVSAGSRYYFRAPLDDYWQFGPTLRLGRYYGHSSELTLGYSALPLLWDTREQTSR